NPIRFEISGMFGKSPFAGDLEVTTDNDGNQVLITQEGFRTPLSYLPDSKAREADGPQFQVKDLAWQQYVWGWQFLNLEPRVMLDPKPQQRSAREIRLTRDGSNIAQYLQSIADNEPTVLKGIAETLKAVLPFVTDFRPAITKELQRNVYLRL